MKNSETRETGGTMHAPRIMTALFSDRSDAEKAFQELLDRDFTRDQINLLMSEDSRKNFYSPEMTRHERGTKGPKEPASARPSAVRSVPLLAFWRRWARAS